jgi:hypothetical protein
MSAVWDITEDNLRGAGYRPLIAGDDYDMGFTVTRGGVVLDLTGAKIWITIKDDAIQPDSEAQLQMDSDTIADINIDDATSGHFIISFHGNTAPNTADLEGEWVYDIQALLSSGALITLSRGVIEFLPNLTRTVS